MPSSSLHDRANRHCQLLAESLTAAVYSESFNDVGFGTGIAGIGMALATAQSAGLIRVPEAVLVMAHEKLIEAVAAQDLPVGLYQGLAGVAWSIGQLPQLSPSLEPLDLSDAYAYLGEIVEHYPAGAEYELTLGLLGLGVVLCDIDSALNLSRSSVEHVLGWLARNAELAEGGHFWRTRFQAGSGETYFNQGEINLGLAHGNLGVIGWLANLVRSNVTAATKAQARELLSGAVRWIMWATSSAHASHQFGPTLRLRDHTVGVAWCYGDLPAACVLARAAQALENSVLMEAARAVAVGCTGDGTASSAHDLSLCHGLASRVYMNCRAAELFETEILRTRADQATQALVDYLDRYGLPATPGLLTGSAGILCALGTWLELPLTRWNTPLLL